MKNYNRTDFQCDLQAWLDDEKSKMLVETWEIVSSISDCIGLLPSFVKFMTVEELLQVIEDN